MGERTIKLTSPQPAIAGRINVIAPFFPFSPKEQAVVARKFPLALQDNARLPIDMEKPQLRYVGRAHIDTVKHTDLCEHIAKTRYVKQLGARSISNAVDNITRSFAWVYSQQKDVVTEAMNDGPLTRYTVQLVPGVEGGEGITVFRDEDPVDSH